MSPTVSIGRALRSLLTVLSSTRPRGEYARANPPAAEAAKRELFFNLIHETGHAFNLAHSFQKHLGGPYSAPAWMPLTTNPQALSWMNYPDSATPGGGAPRNASWFYRRFRYRFDDAELLFLRHAPERYVQMGADAWFSQHARVARDSTDPRLQLSIRVRKTMVEHGEPVILELKLKNVSDHPVPVHGNLDLSDGLVEIAITNPKGERRPFLPFDHTRKQVVPRILEPGKESLYELADVTMGAYGFHFQGAGSVPDRSELHQHRWPHRDGYSATLRGKNACRVCSCLIRRSRRADD
jgi:hypothetical protein